MSPRRLRVTGQVKSTLATDCNENTLSPGLQLGIGREDSIQFDSGVEPFLGKEGGGISVLLTL